jgi:gliding motility-associated-like protein
MTVKISDNIKLLILILIFSLFSGINETLHAQRKISGVINKYGRVSAIGTASATIPDEAQFDQFTTGDTIMLIQMKGVRILTQEAGSFGTFEFNYGLPGQHEFLIIESLNDASNTVTFRTNIIHSTFSPQADLQIIKVPSYNYAEVTAPLTCQPWDSISKTGGVLAAIIGRTLSLQANIDVTGKGFKGGAAAPGLGICAETPKMYKFAYAASTDSAGFKGEGPVSRGWLSLSNFPPIYPDYAKGKGPNFSGGGGGDGRFSGGGGGGNYGAGGLGGKEELTCTFEYTGGLGGLQIKGTYLANTLKSIFPGGGGGASTYVSGGTATAGGNGGGIVIIVCDTLRGNGKSILAEGAQPAGTASGNAGAGGGGGGGSIAIYLQSYSGKLATSGITLSVNGGKGGNTSGIFGEGGGGGGGLITTNNIALPSNGSKTIAGGQGGTRSPGIQGSAGLPGENLTTFAPVLNGFLFNSIRSNVTGNQVDSICSNTDFPGLSGTTPVGGTTPYTYLWEASTISESTGFAPAPGINNQQNYVPPSKLTQTTWFRRIVTDANATPLVDISKPVQVIVQQAITGNLVGKDTTICYGQNPLSLIPLNSGPSNGNGIYTYQWLANTDNNTWTLNAPGTSTLASYDPASLTVTSYYKRLVTSGRCIDLSGTVSITVLPSITGNVTTRPDSVICQGSLFPLLGASAPGAGSGTYVYQWQDSTSSGNWKPASGVNTNPAYTVDTLDFSAIQDRYFRRVVFSGPDSVCRDKSLPLHLTRYFKISNNNIAADNTICSGSTPIPLTGSSPTQGDGTYTYIWQQSSNGTAWSSNASGTFNLINYSPPSLTDSTWYRRIVNSSKCTSISNIVVINVHKPVLNNLASLISGTGTDTTICSGAVPNTIIGSIPTGGTNLPGDYAYQWSSSVDGTTFTDISTGGTLKDYKPGALTTTTWFRRKAISGLCSSISNSIKVTVLPPITDNVITSSRSTVCYNQVPLTITGTGLTGGAGGIPKWIWQQSSDGVTWSSAAGTNNQQNYTPPALTAKRWFRRIILSGPADCCSSTSNVFSIDIDPLPTGAITTLSDTSICNGQKVRFKIHLTGAPGWTLTFNENSNITSVSRIHSADTVLTATPVATASLSVFNYSLGSLTDNNGCSATTLTGTRKANVYRVPVANAGPDDQVCGPEYTLAAVPSDGTGTWTFPSQVISSVPSDPRTKIKIDSSFSEASVAYKFYWEEKNWQCANKDSVTITFFNRIDTISAGADSAFMSFDYLIRLNAYKIQPFESGKWSLVSGAGDFEDDSSNKTEVRNISIGLNTYKWTVTNGPCRLEDLVNMEVASAIVPEAISPNGDNINDELEIRGLNPENQDIELTIVNGAGALVFSTTNMNNSTWKNWDGKNSAGAELPEGTYFYLLKVNSVKTGLVIPKSGFIILKRR